MSTSEHENEHENQTTTTESAEAGRLSDEAYLVLARDIARTLDMPLEVLLASRPHLLAAAGTTWLERRKKALDLEDLARYVALHARLYVTHVAGKSVQWEQARHDYANTDSFDGEHTYEIAFEDVGSVYPHGSDTRVDNIVKVVVTQSSGLHDY